MGDSSTIEQQASRIGGLMLVKSRIGPDGADRRKKLESCVYECMQSD